MTKYLTNNLSVVNLYKKPSKKSEVVTQMLFGESFALINKTKSWLKIKLKDDGYKGYIQNKKFSNHFKPSHKVHVLKANIYSLPNEGKKIGELSFNSKIKVVKIKKNFLYFLKGWIKKNDVKKINYMTKNPFKKIQIFKNVKYKWGGKSFKGIDCSALIQICLNFNNRYCPRDTKDQVNYFKKSIKIKNIKKNNLIYWKGHVALALSSKKLIHAYGPLKKTLIMDLQHTINRIKKTANLEIIGIKKI